VGYEYTLKVPQEAMARVSDEAAAEISRLLETLGPDSSRHVAITLIPEGLLLCDHLSDRVVAAVAFQKAIQWLLRFSPNVVVEDA